MKMKMKIELFALTLVVLSLSLSLSSSLVSLSYGQISQYMDPQDPTNLTKLCNNYINSGVALPGDVLVCADYLNQTILDKYGIGPPSSEGESENETESEESPFNTGGVVGDDNDTDTGSLVEATPFSFPGGTVLDDPKIEGNRSAPMEWLEYDDPLLQFSIEYPSTWDIRQQEDIVSFEIPDTYSDFDVIVEPLLTLDHAEYARDTLNERRKYSLEIIGLNETSINGQPATLAQYDSAGTMTLSYFMVTDDYTGYRLLYAPDDRDDDATQRMPMIEKMANSFRITK